MSTKRRFDLTERDPFIGMEKHEREREREREEQTKQKVMKCQNKKRRKEEYKFGSETRLESGKNMKEPNRGGVDVKYKQLLEVTTFKATSIGNKYILQCDDTSQNN